jgi:small-conductance mechanosensitive channel
VRDWIAHQERAAIAEPPSAVAEAAGVQAVIARRLVELRAYVRGLAEAVPRVPEELLRAGAILRSEVAEHGLAVTSLLVAAFAALGFGTEWLFWWLTAGWRRRIVDVPLATVDERLRAVLRRLVYGVLVVGAFALGSLGAFLAFAWPPLLQEIVAAGLFVVLVGRIAAVLGRILLAPGAPRFRVLPMPQASAEHWFLWFQVIAAYAAAEFVVFGLLRTLGVGEAVRAVLIQAWAFGGMAITLVALFRRPAHREDLPGARNRTRLIAAVLVLANLARTVGAFPLAVLLIVAVALPAAIGAARRAVAHLLRPPGSEASGAEPPRLGAAMLERGLQAALILLAAWLVARAFGLGLDALSRDGPGAAKLARGVLDAVVVLLAADLAWHLARSWIDRRLFEAAQGNPLSGALVAGAEGGEAHAATTGAGLSPDELRHRARLLTLLPILRNVGFVVVAVMAVLMALSALGVQVGPLLAGAGVVGVAVGFGAQTLVKDIISGMFYLLDDAFRVGEYIQAGSHKGTVESFSLRSVKLRHHRGPLTTVPFGELGAIENLSRDWVIDKITVGVTYDTDLDRLKRIVKQVSKEIMAEPELASGILEPLKSQGVYQLGDFAIQVRMKIMTKPGEQFVVRRAIYSKIKKAFEANGIKFATPTVSVTGAEAAGIEPGVEAAAARQALEFGRQQQNAAAAE